MSTLLQLKNFQYPKRRVSPIALAKGDLYNDLVYYVYILKLSNNSIYIGSAANLKKRAADHRYGLVSSTKNHQPVKLAWYCTFPKKDTAMKVVGYCLCGQPHVAPHSAGQITLYHVMELLNLLDNTLKKRF